MGLVAPAVPMGQRAPALRAEVSSVERSPAMPFLPRPQKLKGMVGDKGFDPLGLSDWVPVEWLRESELKHGRVCMLAVVGFVATDLGFRLPGEMHNVASINAHDMAVDLGANDPEMQLKELENGRLAMLAFSGIVTQAVLT